MPGRMPKRDWTIPAEIPRAGGRSEPVDHRARDARSGTLGDPRRIEPGRPRHPGRVSTITPRRIAAYPRSSPLRTQRNAKTGARVIGGCWDCLQQASNTIFQLINILGANKIYAISISHTTTKIHKDEWYRFWTRGACLDG